MALKKIVFLYAYLRSTDQGSVCGFFFKVDIENSPDEETFLKLTKKDRKHMQIQIYWRYFKFNFYFEFGHGQRGFFLFFLIYKMTNLVISID